MCTFGVKISSIGSLQRVPKKSSELLMNFIEASKNVGFDFSTTGHPKTNHQSICRKYIFSFVGLQKRYSSRHPIPLNTCGTINLSANIIFVGVIARPGVHNWMYIKWLEKNLKIPSRRCNVCKNIFSYTCKFILTVNISPG